MDTGKQAPKHDTLHVNSVHATNFRRFRKLDLALHDQLTVLVAPNAVGKTACLDAIAGILGALTNQLSTSTGRHYAQSDIRRVFDLERSGEMEVAHDGLSVTADISLSTQPDSTPVTVSRSLAHSKRARTTMKDAAPLKKYAETLKQAVSEQADVTLPVVGYYGTSRLWRQHRDTEPKKLGRTSRFLGYLNCLEPASNYKTLDKLFTKWSMVVLSDQVRRMARDLTKDAEVPVRPEETYINCVQQAMEICLEPTGWTSLLYAFEFEAIVAVHQQSDIMPIAELSDGVRSMVTLVADIALRCAQLNPHLGDEANTSPGVVLIDEVDMHLHPTWQQTVLGSLLEAFPNIQFIVTTHSPQVLSTVPADNIRILTPVATESDDGAGGLDDSHIVGVAPQQSPFAQPAGFALETIMGTHAAPQAGSVIERVVELKAELELAVRSGRESEPETQNTLSELEKLGYTVRPADMALWRTLATYRNHS